MISASFWDGLQQGISGIEKGLAIQKQEKDKKIAKEERLNNERALYQSAYRPMDSEIGKQMFPDNTSNLSIENYLNQKLLDPKEVDLTNNDSIANFSNKWSKKANDYFDPQIKEAEERGNKELANSLIAQRDKLVNGFQAGQIGKQLENNNRLVKRAETQLNEKDDIARAIQHKSNVTKFETNFTNDSHTGFSMMMNGDLKGGIKFLNDLQDRQLKVEAVQSLSKQELHEYESARASGLAYGLANALRARKQSYTDEDLRGMIKDLNMPNSMKEGIIKFTNEIITSLYLSDSQVASNREIERRSRTTLDAVTNNNISSFYNKYPNIVNPLALNGKTEVAINDRGDKIIVGNLFDERHRQEFFHNMNLITGAPSEDMLLLRDLAIQIESGDVQPTNIKVGEMMQNLNPQYPDLRFGLKNTMSNPDYQIKAPDGKMVFDEGTFIKKNNISKGTFDTAKKFFSDKFLGLGNNSEALNGLMYSTLENLPRSNYTPEWHSSNIFVAPSLDNDLKEGIRKTIKQNGGVVLSLNNGVNDNYTIIPNIKEFDFRINSINKSFPENFNRINKDKVLLGDPRETKKFLGAEYVVHTLEKFKGDPTSYKNLKDFLYNSKLSPINDDNLDNISIQNGKLMYRRDGKSIEIEKYIQKHFESEANKHLRKLNRR